MPGRRFPGVVIQGDSLSILFNDATTIAAALDGKAEETFFTAPGLAKKLEAHVRHFEETLQADGTEIPYSQDESRSTEEYVDRR